MQYNSISVVLYCKSFSIHAITSLISIQEEKMENRPKKKHLVLVHETIQVKHYSEQSKKAYINSIV